MGRLIVAWRDVAGTICVADAYCPHIGARLSPSVGGTIHQDRVKCPFHGFEFAVSGECTWAPGGLPSKCQLDTYDTIEAAGFVFAYYGSQSRKPDWTPPELDLDGWSECRIRKFTVHTHPQDIAENSVDINHLLHVHRWEDGRQSAPARIDGQYYTAGFSYRGRSNIRGLRRFQYETVATMHVWGLGYVYTESTASGFGALVRNWWLASPVDENHFVAFIAVQSRREGFRKQRGSLRSSLYKLGGQLLDSYVLYESAREFSKDIEIWDHRRYVETPTLCSTDGALYKLRQYSRQFYHPSTDNSNEEDSLREVQI